MTESPAPPDSRITPVVVVAAFWFFVGLPLAWGVYRTIVQASQLFQLSLATSH